MANVIIRLVVNPETKKKDVIISYLSESDALPIEHEDEHRRIVDALLDGGTLKAAELGEIVVSRADPAGTEAKPRQEQEAQGERKGLTTKG